MKAYTVHIPIHIFEKGNSNGHSNAVKININAKNHLEAKSVIEEAILNLVASNATGNKP